MKYAILLLLLAATLPASALLRRNPWVASKAWMLMGFLPFVLQILHLNMAAFSWTDWSIENVITYALTYNTDWPGYVHAMEISVLDVLALALYLSLPRAQHPLPFRISMLLYFIAASLSAFQAPVPVASLFYIWQLARMFLIYAVVTRASSADTRVVISLLQGMAAGLFLETGVAIWQRFGLGIVQTGGTFSHQNLLGIMSHFAVFPFFALLLAGRRLWLPAAVTLTAILVDVLTVSRGALAMTALGIAAVYVISVLRRGTQRKVLILLAGVFALVAISPFAFRSLEDRFGVGQSFDPTYYYNDRLALERAAAMILSDHPFGIGANNYVLVAINEGYDRAAGVVMAATNLLEEVHNVYWLVAAESGYVGLVTFLFFLLRPLSVAFLCSRRTLGDQRSDLLMGLGVALAIVYIHSFWEWIFVDYQVQYMFAMTVGSVAGLAEQLGYFKRRYPQSVRFRVGTLQLARWGPRPSRPAWVHATARAELSNEPKYLPPPPTAKTEPQPQTAPLAVVAELAPAPVVFAAPEQFRETFPTPLRLESTPVESVSLNLGEPTNGRDSGGANGAVPVGMATRQSGAELQPVTKPERRSNSASESMLESIWPKGSPGDGQTQATSIQTPAPPAEKQQRVEPRSDVQPPPIPQQQPISISTKGSGSGPQAQATSIQTPAAPPPEPQQRVEPRSDVQPPPIPQQRPVSIVKSGVVDGAAYTLYSDGSVEVRLPEGALRFGSITELRDHIKRRWGAQSRPPAAKPAEPQQRTEPRPDVPSAPIPQRQPISISAKDSGSGGQAQATSSRTPAAPPPEPRQRVEPRSDVQPPPIPQQQPVSILKSGVVDGTAYTLYSDGSVEVRLPEGTRRFGSITELRDHMMHR